MAKELLAEALARIEHKVDLLIAALAGNGMRLNLAPMQSYGHSCPVCMQVIEYQIDIGHGVVVRKCKCSTGKIAPIESMFPSLKQPTMSREDSKRSNEETMLVIEQVAKGEKK